MSAQPIEVVSRPRGKVLQMVPRPGSDAPAERPAPWWRVSPLDVAIVLTLFVLAVLIRLPLLSDVPVFTDETVEVLFGLEISRAEMFPLTGADTYYGPLWSYLLAAAFSVFGPSLVLPRAIVMVTGSLAVVVTYLFGREIGGRAAGLVAAGLLLTAPWQILTHSHVAWSHTLTPLLVTLALLLLVRALKRENGWLLVGAGFVLGLAVQSHPTAVVVLPGVAVATLLHPIGRRWLRTPWPYLAGLAAALAYSPIIAYNLLYPGGSFAEGSQRTYAVADLEGARYLSTLLYLPVRMLHDLLGIAMGPVQEIHHLPWPSDPGRRAARAAAPGGHRLRRLGAPLGAPPRGGLDRRADPPLLVRVQRRPVHRSRLAAALRADRGAGRRARRPGRHEARPGHRRAEADRPRADRAARRRRDALSRATAAPAPARVLRRRHRAR